LKGIPQDSRVAKDGRYITKDDITEEKIAKVTALNEIAEARNQSMAQMAVAWLLKDERVTTVLVGVSRVSQLKDNIHAIENTTFSSDESEKILNILNNVK
jgi:L-glyceraldehyde 3-phosphate reductase